MKKPALTVGVALIQLLERYQVEHVFGIPGVHTIELYRGLAQSSIQHHTPRHEQGAGFMADGYARVSRKPGVCFVITGPGLSNIATAMGQALADSIPMLVISSVNDTIATPQAQGRLHEMPDQLAFSSQVARYSQTILTAEALPLELAKAFRLFASQRPGPVHLQIPVSLLGTAVEQGLLDNVGPVVSARCAASDAGINDAAALLNAAQKPVILAGGGSIEAASQIKKLAEMIDAPVHLTINARGVLDCQHKLAVPASCTIPAVREVVNQADVVLALGTELSQTDYDQFKDNNFTIKGRLIRCDIDPLQINNNYQAEVGLTGDVGKTVERLIGEISPVVNGSGKLRAEEAMHGAMATLQPNEKQHLRILESIRDQLPDCIFVGDSTQIIYTGNMIFNTTRVGCWLNSSVGFGTLGYALPAATGAALASNHAPVVCLIGDGGIQFVLAELGTLKDAAQSVAVVVWCNGGYQEIKNSMQRASVETIGVEFTVPDYIAIANAYGIDAVQVSNEQDICEQVHHHFVKRVPVVIVVNEHELAQPV